MPVDVPEVSEIRAQVAAEVEYHKGDGIVPLLPRVTNPTLVVTASEDITNPPSNQVSITLKTKLAQNSETGMAALHSILIGRSTPAPLEARSSSCSYGPSSFGSRGEISCLTCNGSTACLKLES